MGKVEKIVVLGVVFLIVVILVVATQSGDGSGTVQAARGPSAETSADERSLSEPVERPGEIGEIGQLLEPRQDGADPREQASPGIGDLDAPAAADPGPSPVPPRDATAPPQTLPAANGVSGPPLLHAAVLPSRPIYEVPEAIPEDWDLVTLAGLADHLFDPTLKVYTPQAGETFRTLAQRYYGDPAFVAALERNNEGIEEPQAGQQILVPIRGRAIVDEPGSVYVVQDGDSLWRIAKKVYGAGHRWNEIWDANRDVLVSEDDVMPGVSLVIP